MATMVISKAMNMKIAALKATLQKSSPIGLSVKPGWKLTRVTFPKESLIFEFPANTISLEAFMSFLVKELLLMNRFVVMLVFFYNKKHD